jgi:hypothetical protein
MERNYNDYLIEKTEEEYNRIGAIMPNCELLQFYEKRGGKLEFKDGEKIFKFIERFKLPYKENKDVFLVIDLMREYYMALKETREILEDKY